MLKEKTFLSKAMLIERKKDDENIIEYLERTVSVLLNDNIYTQEQRNFLIVILDLILRRKIKNDEITNKLIEKLKNKEEKEMLAILDAIDEENERILQQGIREGIRKTKISNAQKMKKANLDIKLIIEITGLSKKEIENL